MTSTSLRGSLFGPTRTLDLKDRLDDSSQSCLSCYVFRDKSPSTSLNLVRVYLDVMVQREFLRPRGVSPSRYK